jgi:hypothetical protein
VGLGLSEDFDSRFRTLDDGDQEAVVVAVERVKRLGADLDASPLVVDIGRWATAEPARASR